MKFARNVIRDRRGEVLQVLSLRSAVEYITKFFTQPEDTAMKGGSRKYITLNGFASREYAEEIPNQGHAKVILTSLKLLHDRAIDGDAEAAVLLTIISEVNKTQQGRALREFSEHMAEKLQNAKATG